MKYYLIAGEASGDLHGANLMRALLKADPHAVIRFWGGDHMAQLATTDNITQVKHIRDLAYMGFIEVLMHLRTVLGNIGFCKQDLLQFHPDAVIYIDYPGFNLKIAKFAHAHNLRNFHYISPQLWAWKKGRIKQMRKDLDRLYCILPFEQDFYAHNNFPQARFVGHPLLDAVPANHEGDTAVSQEKESSDNPFIALLPGSRKQELRKMLPPMLAIARRHPNQQFAIAGMSLLGESFYQQLCAQNGGTPENVTIHYDATYQLLSHAHAAIVCSGTATLETALFNVPQVVCYRANALSIAIARFFVGKRVKYISLVNLIADKPIVTELIQGDMDLDTVDAELTRLTTDTNYRNTMRNGYSQVRQLLGGPGASSRVVQDILSSL